MVYLAKSLTNVLNSNGPTIEPGGTLVLKREYSMKVTSNSIAVNLGQENRASYHIECYA